MQSRVDSRPNRLARGMQKTCERSNQSDRLSDDALRLCVRGTTDVLHGLFYRTTHRPCPCCGAKSEGKLILNETGRRRLRFLRRRQEART